MSSKDHAQSNSSNHNDPVQANLFLARHLDQGVSCCRILLLVQTSEAPYYFRTDLDLEFENFILCELDRHASPFPFQILANYNVSG
jgi:hypothetical protein